MRIHQLTIEAFGPFGGQVDVDFEPLNDAGQFLISGPTGSGKTSILDAVCFALYGQVPGERQRAKHLRSDHAAANAEPLVTLTMTLADRLIRITRSPAWNRPKKRGEGTVLQQATVRLEQQVGGDWQVLATRLDEAGDLINTWLGMTPTQFTQVALLPQGGFQTFLHAPVAERQAVLQRLFRTDRFERVEKWFGDLRRQLNRERTEQLHGLEIIAATLQGVTGGDEPPPATDDAGSLIVWADEQGLNAQNCLAETQQSLTEATAVHQTASAELKRATDVAAVLQRAAVATQHLRELDEDAETFAADTAALRAHEQAQQLVPLIEAYGQAEHLVQERRSTMDLALRDLQLTEADRDDLPALRESAEADVQRAAQAHALADDLAGLVREIDVVEERWQAANDSLEAARAATATIPDQQRELTELLAGVRGLDGELATCEADLKNARAGLDAARQLETLQHDLTIKQELYGEEKERVQNLREAYQDAREARIEAMASELAGDLVAGCSCPVCGSTAHPAPATRSGSIGRKAEERARRAHETAVVELEALGEVLRGLTEQRATLSASALDRSVDSWTDEVNRLADDQKTLLARLRDAEQWRLQESELSERLADAQQTIHGLLQLESEERTRLHELTKQRVKLTDALTSLLGDYENAASLVEAAGERMTLIDAATEASARLTQAEGLAADHLHTLNHQASVLGFADGAEATALLLDPVRAAAIAAAEQDREQRRIHALAVLNDAEVIAHRDAVAPDLQGLQHQADAAEEQLAGARTAHQVAQQRAEQTSAIIAHLHRAWTEFQPLDAKAAEVAALSGLLEGTGTDNRLRMRLSAFVLAERLRQVIAAANARLEIISEGRYVLNYREERGAGDSRGGLGLAVLDAWTGVQRDPTTLSGGETFVVSLCLALGLADTVADESGGVRLDTLFIDEGFGSLDAQTLDSVIDILGQLSQGGRVTGVVSHVQELRERLPAVLEVVTSKSGSTVKYAAA